MDFKFRSIEERSSIYFSFPPNFSPPPTNLSYFTQQAIQAGFTSPDPWRREFHRDPNDFRESVQQELEKERIRAEIIAEEILRRRLLEEEVRREMILEREMMALSGGSQFGSPGSMRVDSRFPLISSTHFESRGNGFRGSEPLPFQRDPGAAGCLNSGMSLQEIKAPVSPIPEVNRDKVIILAKPKANASSKRKATTPPGGDAIEFSSVGVKKHKMKGDWSCALCHVTATSERGLNEHLQGKKHKARQRGLVTERTGFGTGPLPQKSTARTRKPIEVPGVTNTPSFRKKDDNLEGEPSLEKVDKEATKKMPESNDTQLKKKKKFAAKKKTGKAVVPQKTLATSKPKKKFRFWCEMCQVGAYSEKVMNSHKEGKRHLENLGELNQTDEAVKENKISDVATEEKLDGREQKREESKERSISGNVARVENKYRVVKSVGGYVKLEEDNNQEFAKRA